MRELARCGMMPKHIETAPIGSHVAATVYDESSDEAVNLFASTGLALVDDLALCKALTEHVERACFQEAVRRGELGGQRRSDGFAAFPRYPLSRLCARAEARKNALNEAIERFVWARWWDDDRVRHEIHGHDQFCATLAPEGQSLWRTVERLGAFERIEVVSPGIDPTHDVELLILIGVRANGGFVTGGAAGDARQRNATALRALFELLRHELAARRKSATKAVPSDLYETRLRYFAGGHGNAAVRARLQSIGEQNVILPSLEIDRSMTHQLHASVAVHACRFEHQPEFVGGPVERLCL